MQRTKGIKKPKLYKLDEIKLVKRHFETTDGKFCSKPNEYGFSFWYENLMNNQKRNAFSDASFDYFFAVKGGEKEALRLLNKFLS